MFQKGLKLLLLTGVLAIATVSCKKQDPLTPPLFSEFVTPTSAVKAAFLVDNSGNSVYKLPVGITTTSNKDITVNFTYSSSTGATAGTQYTAPASVTIPAGKVQDTLVIKGIYAGLSSTVDSVKITISGGDAPANAYNNVFSLGLKKS